jgi:hypothetical protein
MQAAATSLPEIVHEYIDALALERFISAVSPRPVGAHPDTETVGSINMFGIFPRIL